MTPDDLFRRGTHMRNHEDSDGATLQTSGTLQQSLVIRCNSGNEAIRAAGSGDGRHGVCVPKCATLCARRKSGFSLASRQKIAIAVVVQLLRAVHQLVGLAWFGCRREVFSANAGDFLARLGSTRANQCILTGDGNGLTRFQMRFRHRIYQVWGCSVSDRWSTPLDAATTDKEMASASGGAPHGGKKRKGLIAVTRQFPARKVIRKQIEVDRFATSTGAAHDDMPFVAVFTDHISDSLLETVGNLLYRNQSHLRRWDDPAPKSFQESANRFHP